MHIFNPPCRANNILFDSSDACKIVDWQFTAVGNIFLDFGTTAWISMSSADTAANQDKIIAAYLESFKQTCERMKCQELPWNNCSLEEFARRAREERFLLAFLWCSTSYELVHKYPALKERVHWVLRQSVEYNPEAFQ